MSGKRKEESSKDLILQATNVGIKLREAQEEEARKDLNQFIGKASILVIVIIFGVLIFAFMMQSVKETELDFGVPNSVEHTGVESMVSLCDRLNDSGAFFCSDFITLQLLFDRISDNNELTCIFPDENDWHCYYITKVGESN